MSKYAMIELQHKFNNNPYDLDCGLKLFETQIDNSMDEAIATLEKLVYNHPPQELLICLDKITQFSNVRVLKVFESILDEGYFITVAKKYAKYLRKLQKEHKITRNLIMSHFEKILTQFSNDYFEGAGLFKQYRKFLKMASHELDEKIETDANSKLLREKQIKILMNLISLDLRLKGIQGLFSEDLTWDEYSEWEIVKEEQLKLNDLYKQTFEKTLATESFEKMFREVMQQKRDMAVVEPIEALQGVIQQFNDKEVEQAKVVNFFELGLESIDTLYQGQAWQMFLSFLSEHTNDQMQLKYYKRASKRLEIGHSVPQLIMRCLESLNREDEELEQEYNRMIRLQAPVSQVILQRARIFFYTRRIFRQGLTDKEKQQSQMKIRQLFQQNIEYIHTLPEDLIPEQEQDSYTKWARIEAQLFGDSKKSQEVMELCVKRNSGVAQVWETYIEIYNCVPITTVAMRDKMRGIYKRAVECIKDNHEHMFSKYVEFEALFGTVGELQKAEQKLLLLYKGDEDVESIGESVEESVSSVVQQPQKRKRERKEQQQEQEGEAPTKKGKMEDEPKIFIDRNNTIFIKFIPLDISEEELLDILPNKDAVHEIRFVKDREQRFKGFAYIDFLSSMAATNAVKKLNGYKLGPQELYAAISKPPKVTKDDNLTLFLNNLPFTVTDQKIQEKLAIDSTIEYTEIRIIRGPDDKPKGYGYVEFKDSVSYLESLEKAQEILSSRPLIDGRKVFVEKADSLGVIKKKQKNQVLLIKNLSFKAREKDIKELFEGMQITQILIPRDERNKPKGFAFVEFQFHNEFQKALNITEAKVLGRPVQIVKSDREITRPKEDKDTTPKNEVELQLEKPKSNADFKKFL